MSDNSLVLKIVFIIVFFFLALGSGILPAKSKRCNANPTILGIANSFAAGVFLAIAFMHILPEVIEDYYDRKKEENGESEDGEEQKIFPLPYLIFFLGYTFILIIDRVIFDSHALFEDDHHGGGHGHDEEPVHDPAEKKLIDIAKKSILATQQAIASHDPNLVKKSLIAQKESIREGMRSYLSKTEKFSVRMSHALRGSQAPLHAIDEQQELFVDKQNLAFKEDANGTRVPLNQNRVNHTDSCYDHESIRNQSLDKITESHIKKHHENHEREKAKKKGICGGINFTPFVLMIALSMHSIFEGIALGLQKNISNVVNIVIAISLHKWAASMSLGISLHKAFGNDFRKLCTLITVFSLATPVGIAMGILLGKADPMVDTVFSCLAGGTFIYIACSEVIVEEFSLPGHKWFKLLAFGLGAATITCLWFLDAD